MDSERIVATREKHQDDVNTSIIRTSRGLQTHFGSPAPLPQPAERLDAGAMHSALRGCQLWSGREASPGRRIPGEASHGHAASGTVARPGPIDGQSASLCMGHTVAVSHRLYTCLYLCLCVHWLCLCPTMSVSHLLGTYLCLLLCAMCLTGCLFDCLNAPIHVV